MGNGAWGIGNWAWVISISLTLLMIETEETVLPCPYARLIVGKRHCRLLIVGNINSDATGFDITNSQFPIPNSQFPIPNSQ